ncbi:repressor of the inhibitor of the protein kinase [Nymphon striatum]|nr:repressor of the inhibitor of the protein kinase [Nymphon striatum]
MPPKENNYPEDKYVCGTPVAILHAAYSSSVTNDMVGTGQFAAANKQYKIIINESFIQTGTKRQKQFDKNKAALSSIVDCIIYLGRQCSALRGHRDDSTADATKNKGNLHALIEFRAKTDENLKIFLDTCPGNASCSSGRDNQRTACEVWIEGRKCEGQAYDTTAAMSSGNRGLQGLFRRDVPNAIYTPCNSHKLNLVIASASKLQQIKNCITEVNETYLFFNASHKRQGFLERVIDIVVARDRQLPEGRKHSKQHKLKGLCKTRWVARFEAIDNFIDLSSSVQTACDIIINPHLYVDDETLSELIKEAWNWDADTKTRAQSILANFGNFEFLVCLVTLRNVLQPLREITARLQKRDLDIRSAYTSLTEVYEDIEALRADIDDRFRLWYEEEVLVMAKELGVDEKVPRAKGRNAYRATHLAESTMKYFKRSCSQELFPNIVVLLQIACVIPVKSCEAERSFSAVRRHKTVPRSTMGEDRLTSLVLMNTYYDTQISTDKVVQRFIQKHPRRLFSHLYEKV